MAPEAESSPSWPRAALPGTKGARGRGRWHTHAFLRAAGWGRRFSGTDPSPARSPDGKLSPHRPGQPGLPLPLRVLAGGALSKPGATGASLWWPPLGTRSAAGRLRRAGGCGERGLGRAGPGHRGLRAGPGEAGAAPSTPGCGAEPLSLRGRARRPPARWKRCPARPRGAGAVSAGRWPPIVGRLSCFGRNGFGSRCSFRDGHSLLFLPLQPERGGAVGCSRLRRLRGLAASCVLSRACVSAGHGSVMP